MDTNTAKLIKKVNAQQLVRLPSSPGRTCWAQVRRPSTNSKYSRAFGNWGNYENRPRPGHPTCGQHQDREQAAQDLHTRTGEDWAGQ